MSEFNENENDDLFGCLAALICLPILFKKEKKNNFGCGTIIACILIVGLIGAYPIPFLIILSLCGIVTIIWYCFKRKTSKK